MRIGIFGTWRAVEGDPVYSSARSYGRALASAGHDVVTGGYSGVMEAANRGASEAGGRSIGVTCPELDRLLSVNPWVNEELREKDLPARLAACLRGLDAALFLPGRAGTVTELSLALELREKGLIAHPVLLVGEHWDDYLRVHADVGRSLPYPSSPEPSHLVERCASPEDLLEKLHSTAT